MKKHPTRNGSFFSRLLLLRVLLSHLLPTQANVYLSSAFSFLYLHLLLLARTNVILWSTEIYFERRASSSRRCSCRFPYRCIRESTYKENECAVLSLNHDTLPRRVVLLA